MKEKLLCSVCGKELTEENIYEVGGNSYVLSVLTVAHQVALVAENEYGQMKSLEMTT